MKSLLPNVRFIDADNYAFNPDIVKNSDVVWLQANYMSHAQYYAIAKHCRSHGIQMRYFTYSSPDKCAEQLVKEDED